MLMRHLFTAVGLKEAVRLGLNSLLFQSSVHGTAGTVLAAGQTSSQTGV